MNLIINTERLELLPLDAIQLRKLCDNLPTLEAELDCRYMAEPIDGFFRGIIEKQAEIIEKNPDNYIWQTFWMIIRKSDRIIVGSSDFKDVPSDNGEVEIGYGLGKQFEHNGYMTETVKAMCNWAFGQGNVKRVIAETLTDNNASQNVLRRCGFTEYRHHETLWWELHK